MKRYLFSLILISLCCSSCALKDAVECKDGETRCLNENAIDTCIGGLWLNITPCENQKCAMVDDVASCVNICEAGDKKCEGSILVECTADHRWQDKVDGVICEGNEQCVTMSSKDGAGVSACLDPHDSEKIIQILIENNIECSEDLLLCGDDNSLYNCISNELNVVKECGAQVCDRMENGIMGCIDACQPGMTKCEGNRLVTCSDRKTYGIGVPCADGTMCAMDKHGEYACVEKKQDIILCSADKCVDNTLYRCVDGLWDNGTVCMNGCADLGSGELGCLTEAPCKLGTMKCENNGPQVCDAAGKWIASGASCGNDAVCMVLDRRAVCECGAGYKFNESSAACEMICEPGCTDGVQTLCAENGEIGKVNCAFGCNSETKACNECKPGCSSDGKMYLSCMDDGSVLKNYCPYGCDEITNECRLCENSCSEDGSAVLICSEGGNPVRKECKKSGWQDGYCENANCIYTDCQEGYVKNGSEDCVWNVSLQCRGGAAQVTIGDSAVCGVQITTADELIALRDAILNGDLSKAPGAPEDLSSTVYIIANDIDLGEQTSWRGIGTAEMPFSGTLIGLTPDVKISGQLTCSENYCGLFGSTSGAAIKNLTFDIDLNAGTRIRQGRVVGSCTDTTFENLVVDGDFQGYGERQGGVCGYAANSTFDRIHSKGSIHGTGTGSWTPTGGIAGQCVSSEIRNSLSEVRFNVVIDRVGGFCGNASNTNFDNDAYVGIFTDSSKQFARVGGFIGDSDGNYINIYNSRVVMRVYGRDAIAGFVGLNGPTINIYNSLVMADITGVSYVSGMGAYSSKYMLENVYSITKVVGSSGSMQFCGNGGTLRYGYYDAALTGTGSEVSTKTGCTNSDTDTIHYQDKKAMLTASEVSLLEKLNENIEFCSGDGSLECHAWQEVSVDVSNLNGVAEFNAPWPGEMLPGEADAIKKLNEDLKSE